ncbi:MAG: nitrilase [Ramlibacter sp.]|nr:nitrilase [Ramlibacter sp.]
MTGATASTLKVAAAQLATRLDDIDANVALHLAAIDDARTRGVQLLLFPELSLVGHSAGRDAVRLALAMESAPVRRLVEAAGPMAVGFGLIEGADFGLFYNSLVFARDGQVMACHRKVALATYGRLDDGMYFARGTRMDLVAMQPGWRVAVGICNDVWQPGLVTAAMMRGATLQLAPISSAIQAVGAGFDNPAGWDLNLRFNAMTWGCPVVMANRVGAEPGLEFWGGSRVLDAFGQEVARADGAHEQLVCAQLDLQSMRRARFTLPTLRDALALAGIQGDFDA